MKNKKGQAAMEFLMTYGWAILVVLIVISALAYFGVLNPSNLLPDTCTFPVGLTCNDHLVTGTTVQFKVTNSGGQDLNIQKIEVTSTALTAPCSITPNAVLANEDSTSYTVTACTPISGGTGRGKDRYDVNITYNLVGSTFTKTMLGEIVTKRE